MKIYLIDGNNVLRADKNWNQLFLEDPERAKNLLVQKVVDFLRDRNNKAIIFFDGFNFIHSHTKVSNKVEIKHAKNKTADETILITIEKHTNKKNLIIVSNDLELRNKAKLYQCQIESSEDFIKDLHKAKTSSGNLDKPDSKGEDLNYWLRVFGEGDDEK